MTRDMECRNLIIKNSMNFLGKSCNMELWSILYLLKLNLRMDFYSIYFAILRENHKTSFQNTIELDYHS